MEMPGDDAAFHSSIPVAADVTVAIVYTVFGVCSLLGNSTLLCISYKRKHLLKPAEFFIVNLAVSDIGLTLSLYPLAIASSFYHRWLFGNTVCLIYAFCGVLFGICSLTTLTLLSIVCFVKVCCPLYGNRFSPAHGRALIACAWLYALFFAGLPLVRLGAYGPEPYGTACCIDWRASNRRAAARAYTLALFAFCFMLPCCVIVASYTGILVTVRASQKAMEQHLSRQTHMSSIQAIIVKMSVAVCTGFFAAWSPYAIVSMWATFGRVEDIPPLAFAVPAIFAKSSTIYNPAVYLLLRPSLRRAIRRNLGSLCLRHRLRPPGPCRCPVRLALHSRSSSPVPARPAPLPPPAAAAASCGDESVGRRPPGTCLAAAAPGDARRGGEDAPPQRRQRRALQETTTPPQKKKKKKKKLLRATLLGKRTSEIDNLQINLEMVPGQAKIAWP